MDLNKEHMQAISAEIRLDYDKMMADPKSPHALCYLDNKFAYLDGKHNVENLCIVGWLLCKHWSDETQATELWHMANPTLLEAVPKEDVLDLMRKIVYVAIDLNASLVTSCKTGGVEKENALKYH